MNRRKFVKTASLGAVASAALPSIGLAWEDIPSRTGKIITGRKLNIACIGIGGQGWHDVRQVASENIVALFNNYFLHQWAASIAETAAEGSFIKWFVADETWRAMFASELLPGLFFLVLAALLPESPRWLVKVGRHHSRLNSDGSFAMPDEQISTTEEPDRDGLRQMAHRNTSCAPPAKISIPASITAVVMAGHSCPVT
jgi:hypothetical protein